MKALWVALGMLALVGVSSAQANLLLNPGFETGAPPFGPADNWDSSARADHASFPRPNNGSLGDFFVFLNGDAADARKWTLQVTTTPFEAGQTYSFYGWAIDGIGDVSGEINFEIGYVPGFDLNLFVPLSQASYTTTQEWAPYAGTTYTVGATGVEIGQNIVVKITASDLTGGPDDIWFDQMTLTPEPGTLALLALGGLALWRRR